MRYVQFFHEEDPDHRTLALEWWPDKPNEVDDNPTPVEVLEDTPGQLVAMQRGTPSDTWGPPKAVGFMTLAEARKYATTYAYGVTEEID